MPGVIKMFSFVYYEVLIIADAVFKMFIRYCFCVSFFFKLIIPFEKVVVSAI